MTKSASFDVIGTCFAFDVPISTIHSRLGPKLVTAAVDPKTLFFSWFYAAQRDFTYVSMTGAYVPIAQVLKLRSDAHAPLSIYPSTPSPTKTWKRS